MDEDERPRSLLDVLAVAYGAIIMVVGLVVVGALAVAGLDDDAAAEPRVARGVPSTTSDAPPAVLRANPALPVTTYYLVYSQAQARTILEIHERTVRSSVSRRFSDMFALAVALPVATAEDSIAARDVIDRAYADYFEGKGPYLSVIDTANWCKDRSTLPTVFVGAPVELAQAISETCGVS